MRIADVCVSSDASTWTWSVTRFVAHLSPGNTVTLNAIVPPLLLPFISDRRCYCTFTVPTNFACRPCTAPTFIPAGLFACTFTRVSAIALLLYSCPCPLRHGHLHLCIPPLPHHIVLCLPVIQPTLHSQLAFCASFVRFH